MDLSTSLSYPDKMELGLDEVNNIRQKLEQANLEAPKGLPRARFPFPCVHHIR